MEGCTAVHGTGAEAEARNSRYSTDGFGMVANEPPSLTSCCTVEAIGFLWVMETSGPYGISLMNAAITVIFAQLCFQTAACGCAQKWSDKFKWR